MLLNAMTKLSALPGEIFTIKAICKCDSLSNYKMTIDKSGMIDGDTDV